MRALISSGVSVYQHHQTGTLSKGFETFGNYLFLKRLAAGGMAEVFLARPASQVGNGRVQVVKRILPHVANNSVFHSMFQTEIQVIMGFNHPQIVQLHDFGEFNGQPYISMEYIEGKNLKEVISKFIDNKENMSVPMALSLIAQGASGLNYAHSFVNKVTGEVVKAIHRDISPHNLILSYEGNLKVIDFGIAKAASGMHEPTRVGTIKGKIAYLSPEQVSGMPVDARSDIFALGIVAWELLTLQRPFHKDGDSDATIIGRIDKCDDYLVPPSTFNPQIPKEVDEVVLKALKRNPDERYATAADFQAALRQVMAKYYPEYSYSDTGKILRTLFADEIEKERKELRDLNLQAQKAIASHLDASTMVMEPSNPGITASGLTNTRTMYPIGAGNPGLDQNQMNDHLLKIEALMKQKASGRHYVMLAFYIISLIVLKLDDKYSVFNLFLPEQPEVQEMMVEEASKNKTSAKAIKQKRTTSNTTANSPKSNKRKQTKAY